MEKIKKQISIFGIYQIMGGILGIALSIYFPIKTNFFNATILGITLLVFLTAFNLKWNSDTNITAFSINIIAIILMNLAFKLREKIAKEEENKLSEIGQS
ncbi:hypothetical protein HNP37_003130 [Flavobacterium nitrogenifigens]|uniref:Uncharacterized protein n=2 Tax=Flavobacterium TaxID=237 RepID=A0A7W7J017_9FLAO|nr:MULTISPECIES: hypothetical protein [Flavobacterium]MBB4803055.1 hypothetical protein [Flavobacterium nitrogenifigens]MBB6388013.1 hypothetical protein [Flavobacterium notoginsengisoli]